MTNVIVTNIISMTNILSMADKTSGLDLAGSIVGLIASGASIIAVIIALITINNWKKQYKTKNEYKFSFELKRSILLTKDRIIRLINIWQNYYYHLQNETFTPSTCILFSENNRDSILYFLGEDKNNVDYTLGDLELNLRKAKVIWTDIDVDEIILSIQTFYYEIYKSYRSFFSHYVFKPDTMVMDAVDNSFNQEFTNKEYLSQLDGLINPWIDKCDSILLKVHN